MRILLRDKINSNFNNARLLRDKINLSNFITACSLDNKKLRTAVLPISGAGRTMEIQGRGLCAAEGQFYRTCPVRRVLLCPGILPVLDGHLRSNSFDVTQCRVRRIERDAQQRRRGRAAGRNCRHRRRRVRLGCGRLVQDRRVLERAQVECTQRAIRTDRDEDVDGAR